MRTTPVEPVEDFVVCPHCEGYTVCNCATCGSGGTITAGISPHAPPASSAGGGVGKTMEMPGICTVCGGLGQLRATTLHSFSAEAIVRAAMQEVNKEQSLSGEAAEPDG